MKSKATGCGLISTVFSSIVLLRVSSIKIIIIIMMIIIIIITIIDNNNDKNKDIDRTNHNDSSKSLYY